MILNQVKLIRLLLRIYQEKLNKIVKIASKLYEDYTADLINDRTYKDLLLDNKQEQGLLELKLNNLLDKEYSLNIKLSY